MKVVHYGDQGFLLSDWAAVESLYNSVMNGADMNMPGSLLSFITAFLYPNHVLIHLGFFACKLCLHYFVNDACLLESVQMETLMNLTLPKLTTLIGVKRLAMPFVMVPSLKIDLMIWSA